jgi:hypothetical protein
MSSFSISPIHLRSGGKVTDYFWMKNSNREIRKTRESFPERGRSPSAARSTVEGQTWLSKLFSLSAAASRDGSRSVRIFRVACGLLLLKKLIANPNPEKN